MAESNASDNFYDTIKNQQIWFSNKSSWEDLVVTDLWLGKQLII